MLYEASFFDAMSGVKKLTNFMHAITCPIPGGECSFDVYMYVSQSHVSPRHANVVGA